MDLFKCCRCKQKLPREAFGGITKRADYCKPCLRAVSREWSVNNRSRRQEINNKAAAKRYRINRKKLWEFLLLHPCLDCGERDPIVLDCDHRERQDKKAQIADILGSWSWSTILTELAKCDIRCANCHRRRTAQQFEWYQGGDAK